MPGESYRRRCRTLLLYLCYVYRELINSFVCIFFKPVILEIGCLTLSLTTDYQRTVGGWEWGGNTVKKMVKQEPSQQK